MIDMPEHEEILRANENILYGNGGVNDKVTAEQVLAQMRQSRSLVVGLVYHKWLKDFNDLLFNELLAYSKFF